MAIINTGLSTAGVKSNFFQAYDAAVENARFNELTTRLESNKDSETYKWLGSIPRMREWGTGRKTVGIRTESYSVENLKYEATIEVDRDEISDDQTGQIMLRIRELAARAASHKDFLLSQLLINGATAGFNSYDGVTFFNAAHESGSSGVQSNILTPSATDPDNPTTAEAKIALGQAIARLLGFVDDTGEPMSIDATGLGRPLPPGSVHRLARGPLGDPRQQHHQRPRRGGESHAVRSAHGREQVFRGQDRRAGPSICVSGPRADRVQRSGRRQRRRVHA